MNPDPERIKIGGTFRAHESDGSFIDGTITNLIDGDGDETDDPVLAHAIVVRVNEDSWWHVHLSEIEPVVMQ